MTDAKIVSLALKQVAKRRLSGREASWVEDLARTIDRLSEEQIATDPEAKEGGHQSRGG